MFIQHLMCAMCPMCPIVSRSKICRKERARKKARKNLAGSNKHT
jgi:hypothetical protein